MIEEKEAVGGGVEAGGTVGKWRCNRCRWGGDEPLVCPATCNGEVVDIIDVMCPRCTDGEPRFTGTSEERNAWWDAYYERSSNV